MCPGNGRRQHQQKPDTTNERQGGARDGRKIIQDCGGCHFQIYSRTLSAPGQGSNVPTCRARDGPPAEHGDLPVPWERGQTTRGQLVPLEQRQWPSHPPGEPGCRAAAVARRKEARESGPTLPCPVAGERGGHGHRGDIDNGCNQARRFLAADGHKKRTVPAFLCCSAHFSVFSSSPSRPSSPSLRRSFERLQLWKRRVSEELLGENPESRCPWGMQEPANPGRSVFGNRADLSSPTPRQASQCLQR